MGKLVLGFIAGVALTSLVFVLFNEPPENSLAESALSVAFQRDTNMPVTIVEIPRTATTVDDAKEDSEAAVLTAPVEEAPLTLAELEKLADAAKSASDVAWREFLRAERVERWANEPAPTQPIVLPPEFGYLSEDPSDNHERIQREAIDPAWAAATESQIHSFLVERPEISANYGYPTVHCRTTRCEIAFIAYGAGEAQDFRSLHSEFFDQAWTDQFKFGAGVGLINASVRNRDDVTTILWHLTHSPERLRTIGRTDDAAQ